MVYLTLMFVEFFEFTCLPDGVEVRVFVDPVRRLPHLTVAITNGAYQAGNY
jgi:hypothetical protein